MRIAVEDNPNCSGAPEQIFAELGPARKIRGIWAEDRSLRYGLDIVGVQEGGSPAQAYAMKIADSSEGHAYLIYGEAWGIRLRRADSGAEWNLSDSGQWGESFKIYGDIEDIIYANE